jgi:CDP-glucose 4,6-dehydratase
MITTDKVYENNETGQAFTEDDKLGGHDPYAASKAAAEIAISSYRNSFFPVEKYNEHQKVIATLRAGNVIGGGDYAQDRIIPDIVRAIEFDEAVKIRHPKAIRPWQHVLEPLFGYLELAALLHKNPRGFSGAYNIGPDRNDMLEVLEVAQLFIQYYGKGSYEIMQNTNAPHEAGILLLDNSKINKALGRQPIWTAQQAIQKTAEWYADKETAAAEKCLQQIEDYAK